MPRFWGLRKYISRTAVALRRKTGRWLQWIFLACLQPAEHQQKASCELWENDHFKGKYGEIRGNMGRWGLNPWAFRVRVPNIVRQIRHEWTSTDDVSCWVWIRNRVPIFGPPWGVQWCGKKKVPLWKIATTWWTTYLCSIAHWNRG